MLEQIGLGVILEFMGDQKVVQGMNRVGAATARMQRGFRDVGAGFNQIGAALTPAVIGLGMAAGGTVQRFASFETSIAKIGTLLPGGIKEARAMGASIEEMSIKYGLSAATVAEGTFQAVSASVPAAKAAEFMAVAQKAAIAGFTDTTTSVNALTNILNAYGDNNERVAENAMRVADEMFLANKYGKTTFEELAHSMGMVAPTGRLAGVASKELAAAIATMTKQGIDTSTSVVSINQALLAFVKPAKEAEKIAAKYGIVLNSATLKSKGFAGALADVQAKIGDNDDALAQIFGNVRSFRAAAVLAGQGAADFNMILGQMGKEAGITNANFEDVNSTITQTFKRNLQAIDVLATNVGEVLVDELGLRKYDFSGLIQDKVEVVKQGVRDAIAYVRGGFIALDLPGHADRIAQAFAPVKAVFESIFGDEKVARAGQMAAALGIMAGAAAPLLLVLKPITGVLAGVLTMGKGIFGMVSGLGGLLGGLGAVLSGPVIAAVAAVGVVIAALATNAGGSRDALGSLMRTVGSLVRNFIMPLVEQIATALRPTFEVLTQVIGTMLVPMIETLKQYWTALLPPITKIIGHLVNIVGKVLPPLIAIISHGLMPVINAIQWGMQNILIPAFDGVITVIEKLLGWLSDLVGWLTDAYTEIGKFFGLIDEQADKAIRGVDKVNRARDAAGVEGVPREAPRIATEIGNTSAAAGGAQAAVAGAVAAEAARSTPVQIDSNLYIDGRNMAVATSRAQLEITERSGADVTPWQRRMIIEHGARPVVVGG